jgi:MFS family permease
VPFLQRYAEVLSPAGATSALLASLVGRLSLGMNGLALLILVRASSGSYGTAGAVAAAYALALAVGSPSRARSADRHGAVRVLLLCGVVHPAAVVGLVLLADAGAPTLALVAAALLMGVTVPPLGSVMRALWGSLVEPQVLPTAYALESVVVELCFVLGPLLVAVLVSAGQAVPLLASASVSGLGAVWLAASSGVRAQQPHPDRASHLAGPLVNPVVRACLLNALFIGAGFGTIEVGVLAFVREQGSARAATGVVLAVWSLGSMAGGLAYGALRPEAPATRQLPVLVTAVAAGACLPVLAPGVVALGVLLVLSGSTIAPFSACNSVLLGASAPTGTVTEAFAWNASMIFGGAAAGTAVAGVVIDAYGARAAFAATVVTAVLLLGSCWRGLTVVRG